LLYIKYKTSIKTCIPFIIKIKYIIIIIRHRKKIDLSETIIENIHNEITDPVINFNVVSFVSWVEVKGTRYSTKHNITIIVDVEDMPKFITIKYIFFKPQSEIPYLIGQLLNTQHFNEHLQAYDIKANTSLICISFNSLLVEHSPCTLNTLSNGCTYISCNL